ncbi:MAG TPA: hypothetical protein VEX86_27335 [Longimicrobium sp.]|nr:hypothetical protein [Longimicrobium sp.]
MPGPTMRERRGETVRAMRRLRAKASWALLAVVLLAACGSAPGGDPAARQRYEADDRRCRAMADSMASTARARGDEVASDEYEPVRLSCMSYRGWKDGKFR